MSRLPIIFSILQEIPPTGPLFVPNSDSVCLSPVPPTTNDALSMEQKLKSINVEKMRRLGVTTLFVGGVCPLNMLRIIGDSYQRNIHLGTVVENKSLCFHLNIENDLDLLGNGLYGSQIA